MSDLAKYIHETILTGGEMFGCVARYEEKIKGDSGNYAYLSGHYACMLAELIRMVGSWNVLKLVDASDSIQARIRELEKNRKPEDCDHLVPGVRQGDLLNTIGTPLYRCEKVRGCSQPCDKHGFPHFAHNEHGRKYWGCENDACEKGNMVERSPTLCVPCGVYLPGMDGQEEGEFCNRHGCLGNMEIKPTEDCSCHISNPCQNCVDSPLWCPECGEEYKALIRRAKNV